LSCVRRTADRREKKTAAEDWRPRRPQVRLRRPPAVPASDTASVRVSGGRAACKSGVRAHDFRRFPGVRACRRDHRDRQHRRSPLAS
jgi:hypothetical protein